MPRPFIIAEIAQGYEGRYELARLLVRAAARSAADAVKFQIVYADDLAVPDYEHYALFKSLEMDGETWRAIAEDARECGLQFYVDVLGPRAAEVTERLGADGIKIHSTCFFDETLMDWAFARGNKVLLSTGGISEQEVLELIAARRLAGSDHLTIMHGYQADPTPVDKTALARIPRLRQSYGLDVGFMDHTEGAGPDTVTVSAMALALGVSVFEKHITLDRVLELEDYVSALTPSGFAHYVSSLRRLAEALDEPTNGATADEIAYRNKVLKRVVATRELEAGKVITAGDVALLRPARPEGLFRLTEAIGRTAAVAIPAGFPVHEGDLA